MTAPEVLPDMIALYEEIALLTGRMLSAAEQHDWALLHQLQQGCEQCADRLAACSTATRLSVEIRQQKIALLRRILANDRQTREFTEPHMRNMEQYIGQQNGCRRMKPPAPE